MCGCDDCGKKVFALDHKGADVVKADWFWRYALCQALSVSNIKLIKRCEELSVTVPATDLQIVFQRKVSKTAFQ